MGKKMSKEKEELAKILDNLRSFARRTDSDVLAVALRRLPDEEADEYPVSGDDVSWVVVGNVSLMLDVLDTIRHKYYKALKKLKEKGLSNSQRHGKEKSQ